MFIVYSNIFLKSGKNTYMVKNRKHTIPLAEILSLFFFKKRTWNHSLYVYLLTLFTALC